MKKTELILKEMNKNNGIITSARVKELGIDKKFLTILLEQESIERVNRGLYQLKDTLTDEYYAKLYGMKNAIYSHMTALYFHGLSIKAPNNKLDITVPNNYFNYKIKRHNVFYVDKDIYELGITEIKTPMGNKVKAYDIERCICDIIRSKNRMDSEHVKYSIREYLKRKDKNLIKLSNYADKMGIKDDVMNYLEVFYE